MGRAPCCDKANVKKGPWSPEEDLKLKEFIEKYGTGGNWIALPHKAGLRRCGKSCRLRWLNYLRPNIKQGEFSDEEDRIICTLFASIGSRLQQREIDFHTHTHPQRERERERDPEGMVFPRVNLNNGNWISLFKAPISSSEMATPHNAEQEAAKVLLNLIQGSKDEPRKSATKLYVILERMRLNGKEHSMPYQVVSRAMEILIDEHGLDIEALKSSHIPLTGGTHMGDSSETQLAEEEDTIKTQERQHKKTGVRISISLDEILQYSKMSRHGAAKKLGVSISTLKRVCRDYGIHRWPPRNKTPQSSSVVRLGEIPQLNPDPPSNQASAGVANTKPHDTTTVRNVNVMTVKAKYVNDITIKFQVSLPLELVELGQHVARRLDLEPGTYHIRYNDEDGDLILIGCDEDLQGYIHNSILQGSTSITLLLEPNGLAELLIY